MSKHRHNPYSPSSPAAASATGQEHPSGPRPAEMGYRDDPSLDLEALRITPSAPPITHIVVPTVRRPKKTEWVRVHPECKLVVNVIDEDRVLWFILPALAEAAKDVVRPCEIHLAHSRLSGECFLWPVPVDLSVRPNSWNASHALAAGLAQKSWVRMVANSSKQAYEVSVAQYGEPTWPEPVDDILRRGIAQHVISAADHPVLRRLRGEV